jgi:hypothetical protein
MVALFFHVNYKIIIILKRKEKKLSIGDFMVVLLLNVLSKPDF